MHLNSPPCHWRLESKLADGTVVGANCLCPTHAKYLRQVKDFDCAHCLLRSNEYGSSDKALELTHKALAESPPVLAPVPLPPAPRPDLKAIALTLPVESPEKVADRTFKTPIFHDDGSIEYPKGEKDWEPPQNINGYVRDEQNKWLFHPLWVPCQLRHQMAFMKANCGCIDVIMRCTNPQAPEFGQRLSHEVCAKCPFRKI